MGNILRFLLSPWQLPRLKGRDPEEIDFIDKAFHAARHGDVAALQALTSHPDAKGNIPLPQVTDPRTSQTLLHAAMGRGSPQCVRFLLAKGCDLLKGDQSRETPLHAACMSDRLENLTAALEGGRSGAVDLEVRDMWDRTPLLKAMAYNSERVMRYLLTRDVNVNARDTFRLTPFHMAVTRGRPDLVELLADLGVDLDPLTTSGESPLSIAISAHNPPMVRQLLLLGASTRSPSQPCVTALGKFIGRPKSGAVCRQAEEVLHIMLAAHGHLLHSDHPGVLQRVLYTADVQRYLPLMYKMLVCSDRMCDDLSPLLSSVSSSSKSSSSSSLLSSLAASSSSSSQQAGERRSQRTVLKLNDLARRSARKALMAQGRNVFWGVGQLGADVPPALKGLLLLKDCDFKEFPTNAQH